MPRISYVNGRYVHHSDALIHIEDRGYQFADGVYEVCLFLNEKALDFHPHMDRLERSLSALSMDFPVKRSVMKTIMQQLLRKNRLRDALIYLQISRGVARRDHAFPETRIKPAIVMTARPFSAAALHRKQLRGVPVATVPDTRWKRCDIKSISLIGNVLAKQAARSRSAMEAWMVDDKGFVTEGASSTAWIIDDKGRLRTHGLGPEILPGITRKVIIEIARKAGLAVFEDPFTVDEAKGAREAFLASSSAGIMPVISIDDTEIGDGAVGALTGDLVAGHWQHVALETGFHLSSSAISSARAFSPAR